MVFKKKGGGGGEEKRARKGLDRMHVLLSPLRHAYYPLEWYMCVFRTSCCPRDVCVYLIPNDFVL